MTIPDEVDIIVAGGMTVIAMLPRPQLTSF